MTWVSFLKGLQDYFFSVAPLGYKYNTHVMACHVTICSEATDQSMRALNSLVLSIFFQDFQASQHHHVVSPFKRSLARGRFMKGGRLRRQSWTCGYCGFGVEEMITVPNKPLNQQTLICKAVRL